MAPSRILSEIKQSKPFASVEQETVVALMKTADHVRRLQAAVFCNDDLTGQQFILLRILL